MLHQGLKVKKLNSFSNFKSVVSKLCSILLWRDGSKIIPSFFLQGEVGQNDVIELNTENHAYVSFGMVLVVWELLPTFITIWFFRVRRPDGSLVSYWYFNQCYISRSRWLIND